MSVYVIAHGKVEDRGLLDQYVAKAIPTLESHQGRVVAYDEAPEVVEGPIETADRHSRILITDSVSCVVRLTGIPRNSPSAVEIDARYSYSRKGLHALLMIQVRRPTLIRPPRVKRTNFPLGLEKQKTADGTFRKITTMPIRRCPSF